VCTDAGERGVKTLVKGIDAGPEYVPPRGIPPLSLISFLR